MYNQELKERYRKEKESYTTVATYYFNALFKKVAPFEEELDKDISNFTTYEIINMYKTLSIMSLDTISAMNSNLSMYTQWCIQQNLVTDYQNHFLEINREMMTSFVNKLAMDRKVVSREQIIDWCQQLPNPSDSFCLLALFEGIKGNGYIEIANAKIDDFKDGVFISCEGRQIKVSNTLVSYAELSNETLDYQSITKTMTHALTCEDNGRIIKNYPNTRAADTPPILRRRIQTKLVRIFNFLGIIDWMNGNDIRMSGIIEMVNLRSKELNISSKEYVYGVGINEIKKQYDFNVVPSVFMSKYDKYLV